MSMYLDTQQASDVYKCNVEIYDLGNRGYSGEQNSYTSHKVKVTLVTYYIESNGFLMLIIYLISRCPNYMYY